MYMYYFSTLLCSISRTIAYTYYVPHFDTYCCTFLLHCKYAAVSTVLRLYSDGSVFFVSYFTCILLVFLEPLSCLTELTLFYDVRKQSVALWYPKCKVLLLWGSPFYQSYFSSSISKRGQLIKETQVTT